ncbi:cupin [Pararhizobium mangrovi]|uniref:Cupin n=2 Tax=Pararhizobium mangrovi TaxID=2590452 RepID=A0A506UBV1_9HYPH|nr:cupin [Pararhizobium mangrovi]
MAFKASGGVPNNPAYPAVVARRVLDGTPTPNDVETLLVSNGWRGTWVWRVFDYHHFHPDAFEVLAIATGGATLMLGGPQGKIVDVTAGDVLLLPPGVGHKQCAQDADFRIVGAYPPGQEAYSTVRGDEGYDDATIEQIACVPVPETDPVRGGAGAMLAALKGGR